MVKKLSHRWCIAVIVLLTVGVGFISGAALAQNGSGIRLVKPASVPLDAPQVRVSLSQLRCVGDTLQVNIPDLQVGIIKGTSMLPLVGSGHLALLLPNPDIQKLAVGDLVAYSSLFEPDTLVAHRIVMIGQDSSGWFAKVQGMNNWEPDLFLVRQQQVKFVAVGVLW